MVEAVDDDEPNDNDKHSSNGDGSNNKNNLLACLLESILIQIMKCVFVDGSISATVESRDHIRWL